MNTNTSTTPAKRRKIAGLRTYLVGITSQTDRSRIRQAYKSNLIKRGDHKLSPMNPTRREALHDAIFTVEDRVESKAGGLPDCPRLVAMNHARNLIADGLGWNG